MEELLTVTRGTNSKPAATDTLIEELLGMDIAGDLFIGFPVIASSEGHFAIDALLLSRSHGLICFDLVEGKHLGDYQSRQDDAHNRLHARLFSHRSLVKQRQLLVPITTVTYAPAVTSLSSQDEYLLATQGQVKDVLTRRIWEGSTSDSYLKALSAVQSVSSIRRIGGSQRDPQLDTKASKLQAIEDSISTLDPRQSRAVIETVEGVQRLRGLAGSGKTIVLALKAAYLHAQHPDWRIAVTFNTRSLKSHFQRLINGFTIEQTGNEPNWERLRVINSWGAPGGADRDGLYHEFCNSHDIEYHDFNSAKRIFTYDSAFDGVVQIALDEVSAHEQLYDAILIDEAQDLSPSFLLLCYEFLKEPKRLVYAYDELQNLSNEGLPPPEVIFGVGSDGKPRVTLEGESHGSSPRDIILQKCYRNSRPILVTAHGLGFGVYRNPESIEATGLVQMFDQPNLWRDIGYIVQSGKLALGNTVGLARSADSSPLFLESHTPLEDIVRFKSFDTQLDQAKWIATQVKKDLEKEGLRHSDIVVVNTNPRTARRNLSVVRSQLHDRGIQSHIAGVDTNPDVFHQEQSITCTGIYRAKGNEAAMVYVIDADECYSGTANLAHLRNCLFTAITRSKAWVRVTGVGANMKELRKEFKQIQDNDFSLRFRYPTLEEQQALKVVHRDVSDADLGHLASHRQALSRLVRDLKKGRIFIEDIDASDVEALKQHLAQRD